MPGYSRLVTNSIQINKVNMLHTRWDFIVNSLNLNIHTFDTPLQKDSQFKCKVKRVQSRQKETNRLREREGEEQWKKGDFDCRSSDSGTLIYHFLPYILFFLSHTQSHTHTEEQRILHMRPLTLQHSNHTAEMYSTFVLLFLSFEKYNKIQNRHEDLLRSNRQTLHLWHFSVCTHNEIVLP